MKHIYEQVEKNINQLVENNVNWAESATEEQMQRAQNGELELMFYDKPVPKEWLGDLKGRKVLCLAGAGGLQAPLFACAGAEVTVLDLSEKMLEKDRKIAAEKGLNIILEHGNMCDLSRFPDGTFDLIFNPPSLFYVPDVLPVFKECYRVLKKGGSFIMTSANPIAYVCDYVEEEGGGYYKAVNRMPYCSSDVGRILRTFKIKKNVEVTDNGKIII